MAYFINPDASTNDITSAINYALANLGGSVSSNLATGEIVSGATTIGYLYQYMDVAFALSYDGSTGFSNTSYTNATYFGLRNTTSTTVSSNPTDYVWYQVSGSGFGTTNYLWYNVTGGRNIQFVVQPTAPAGYYVQWTNDPINLDIVTSTIGVKNNILIIYQWTNGTVPARPTTTSTYTWATNTFTPVPTGWYSSLPSNTTPGNVLFEIQIPLSVNGAVLTSLLDWTNTSYPIIATSANGITGVTGTRTAVITMYQWAVSPPTLFPTGTSTYTWATGVYTAATNPNGWTIIPGTSIAGDILYACDAIFSDNTTSSTSTITWSTSSAYAIGASGVNGQRTAVAQLYQWSATAPSSYPSGTVTYTWATGTFTFSGSLNGWSITPPAPVPGDILYAIDQIITDSATSATTTVTWGSTTEYAIGLAGTNGSAGSNGLSALYGYLVQNQTLAAPSFTTPTTGASLPAGWSATPPTVSVGYTFWYIFGQYNSSPITINGIAPNTTAWTGPTAASVFEDIVSDNWSVGGVPYVTPTYGNPSTYSSTGYYISRNTGDCYFNNGIFRGDITGASGTFSGSVNVGSSPPVLSGHTITSGSGAAISSSGTLALGNSTNSFVFDGTNAYFSGGGTFSGALSAASGTFAGSLSSATGSFTGSLSIGTSPPVLSGHTITSGSGVSITSSGVLALGNSSNSFVFDGTNAYFSGGGNFSGSLSAATGSFAGSLSIGSSPPVISGTTISSGSGLLATTSGSGTFAVGNATQNLVFNSSGIYINGGQLSITNGSTPPSLSGHTMSGAGVLLTSSGTFAVGNSTNNFVFDGSNAYFTGGGTFSGALSAATGSFAGSLSAATGSFTGTVQVGSSPAISGTTMTGSGALINSSGTFALGSSTANIVNNGSSIYLNGFAQGTGSISSTVTVNSSSDTIVMPLSGSSFTTTRPANTIISSSGYIRVQGSWTTGTTPLYGKFLMQFKLLNSSSVNIKNLYVQFGTPCYVTSGTSPYVVEVWINYNVSALITNLAADTYSFNLDGTNFYANAQWYSGGSLLSTVTTGPVVLQSSSYWYQVG